MKKITSGLLLVVVISVFTVSAAFAEAPEKSDGFVCPVLGGKAGGEHGNSVPSPFIYISGGDTSVLGPDVSVPIHATNDNGNGSPGGEHASPGDPGYTAIWKK